MTGEKEFILPIGLEQKGKIHRKGSIRPATALDEIESQEEDKVRFNNRLRDISLLSRVVTRIGDISPVTTDDIENLYEADFIYLQILCREIDKPGQSGPAVQCPYCNAEHTMDVFKLYETGV